MIYIITHKKTDLPELDNYAPLQVGAYFGNDLGYLKDDVGVNISNKNKNYCELTGLYWIWKNINDNYKGLVHYRRYFSKSNYFKRIYSYDELLSFLDEYDIILPKKEIFLQNARDEILISCCTEDIFNCLRNIVKEKYCDYLCSFDDFFNQNKCSLFNMMFTDRKIFDEYSKWLFDILFELEKRIDISDLDDYQKRVYGFLSERLLNVWVLKNNLKVKYIDVVNTETSLHEKLQLTRRRLTNMIRYKGECEK